LGKNYAVNQKLQHSDNVNFKACLFARLRLGFQSKVIIPQAVVIMGNFSNLVIMSVYDEGYS
jgi:hypothetical protein